MWLQKLASMSVKLLGYKNVHFVSCECGRHVNRVWCQRHVSLGYDIFTESNILRLCDWGIVCMLTQNPSDKVWDMFQTFIFFIYVRKSFVNLIK